MNPTTRAYLQARRDLHLTPLGVADCRHTFQSWCDAGFPDADEPAPGEFFGVCPDDDEPAEVDLGNGLHLEVEPEPEPYPEPLQARLGRAEAELTAIAPHLDAGREYYENGIEVPTTLSRRARNVSTALAAETEERRRAHDRITELRADAESVRATNADLRGELHRIAEVLDCGDNEVLLGRVEAMKAHKEAAEAEATRLGRWTLELRAEVDTLRRSLAAAERALASRTLGARVRRALGVGR